MAHNHEHHDHGHGHSHVSADGPLKWTLGIVLIVMIAEFVGGFLSNSLALIGDAGHMLTDALAIILSLVAIAIARRPATLTRTYGYHRVEILAALINGLVLIGISAFIFVEAYQRFNNPPEVDSSLMLIIAVIGLVTNFAGMYILRKASHSSLNVKAAFWHIIGDTVSSVGVIIGGVIIMITGWVVVDAIISVVIGVIILWGAVRIVMEAVDIFLESVPKHLKIEDIVKSVKDIPGVEDLHDIHVWTITSGIYALSAHLLIADQMVSQSSDLIGEVNHLLEEEFNINHTTIQLECESCSSAVICNLSQSRAG